MPVIESPTEKIQMYIDHRNLREDQIIQTLKESEKKYLTAMELVKIIYKVRGQLHETMKHR